MKVLMINGSPRKNGNTAAALENPEDYTARSNIMWPSSLALSGLLNPSKEEDWEVHEIQHQLAAYYNVTHGMGLAAISPAYYRTVYLYAVPRFERFALNVWGVDPAGKTDEEIALAGIDALADYIKSSGMSVSAMRNLCVDFFRYAKSALWTPDEDIQFTRNAAGNQDEMKKGVVYGGLPYISWGTGSIYRLMDYVDEDTGVVDIVTGGAKPLNFGNQCANGAYVGFARVINSAKYGVTATMVQQDGFLRMTLADAVIYLMASPLPEA